MTYTAVNPHACCNWPRPEDAHAAARSPPHPHALLTPIICNWSVGMIVLILRTLDITPVLELIVIEVPSGRTPPIVPVVAVGNVYVLAPDITPVVGFIVIEVPSTRTPPNIRNEPIPAIGNVLFIL